MPDIGINYFKNRTEFLEEQIKELSPINVDEFVKYMYDNYGYKYDTTRYTLAGSLKKYIDNNILKVDNPVFNEEQENIIKSLLVDDLYYIDTLKRILKEKLDVNNFDLINNMNLLKLGYRVRGNYILKNEISNFESYLYNKVIANNYFIPELEYKKMGSTFTSYMYKMMANKDLFKIDENKYITIKGLNELGINKQDIDELHRQILLLTSDNEYFNLEYIKQRISFSSFENKGLTNEFFETIMFIMPELKMFRIDNNKIFIKSDKSYTKEMFISSIIETKEKISVQELKKYLLDKYNIDINLSELKQCINRKRFYYDDTNEYIYLNKELSEKEIQELDILTSIN